MSLPRMPRPATVLAFAALVISLTGSAIAAKKYLITSTKQIKPSVLAQLKGNTGAAGAKGDTGAAGTKGDTGAKGETGAKGDTGAAGATGATGSQGPAGTNGTAGTGAAMGMVLVDSAETGFGPLVGGGYNMRGVASQESQGAQITPNRALVLKDFALSVGLVGSESITATVRVSNIDTAVTCTVAAPASLCTSAATINIPARSRVSVKLVSSTLAEARYPSWSSTLE